MTSVIVFPMQLLSVTQYARKMGISPQAVYQKIRRNKLKTVVQKVDVIRIVIDATELDEVKND